MRTRYFRKLFLLLAAVLMCTVGAPALAADAHPVPDPDQTGSISVTMRDPETKAPVSGGELTLYQVGTVAEENGNYAFALTGAFERSGLVLEDVESAELAQKLAEYASANSLKGTSVSVDKDGVASAGDLELGLYLLVQTEAVEGYRAVSPFLVSVPTLEGGSYVYTVDATPKMSLLTQQPEEPAPQEPAAPSDPKLPQTGQLNWPVPVLAISGLVLFAAGWALRFAGKRDHGHAC